MIPGLVEKLPEVLGGTPVFTGTSVPVKTLLEYWEAGLPVYEFLLDFQAVRRSQAKHLLKWLAEQDEEGMNAAYVYFGMEQTKRASTPEKKKALLKRKL